MTATIPEMGDLPWQVWFLQPRPGEAAEFARLRREGLVRRVIADVHVPADTRDSVLLRAGAVSAALPPGLREEILVVSHTTAWWVHAGASPTSPTDPPETVDVAWPRRHGAARPPVVVRAGRLDPGHVVRIGPIWVTTPARTVVDLLRVDERRERDPAQLCEGIAVCPSGALHIARQAGGLPGVARARGRLASILPAGGPGLLCATGGAGPCGCR